MPSTTTTPELTAVVSSVGMALLQTNALKGQAQSAHAEYRPAGEA